MWPIAAEDGRINPSVEAKADEGKGGSTAIMLRRLLGQIPN
jgi:hypothetical protein